MNSHTAPLNLALDYNLEPDGRFVIKNYNQKKPFSNFLPAIAGLYGTPMWVFYVNRGQAVASFGTRNKDNAMLEFFPANKAYQMTPSAGFRTFIKFKNSDSVSAPFSFYEPFHAWHRSASPAQQSMEISSYELRLREKNSSAGFETAVNYFTLPGEPIAALVREVVVTNISSHPMELELLDGLPQVNPYGMNEFFIKQMSRTIEAWMVAENMEKKAPFLRLKVDATDRPEVMKIDGGNFYFGLLEENGGKSTLLEPWVDPGLIFGPALDFSEPVLFNQSASFRHAKGQICENKTPCAFGYATFRLAPGKSKKIRAYFGHARNKDILNRYLARAKKRGYFEIKREENRRLVEGIKAPIFSISASPVYDHYCGQTYLDNVIRGGAPVCLGDKENPFIFYVYSRKHGDLERDYNRFLIEDCYFSQGDGNYRDVNQNRRHDVWFEPRVADANVKTFLNLVQLDGFNPLVLKGTNFYFKKSPQSLKVLLRFFGKKNTALALEYFKRPFKLGEFCRWLESCARITPSGFQRLLTSMSPFLSCEEIAEHGEGFWVDHWTYNLDLIESYLAIYPERLKKTLLETRAYTFYDNDHRVKARDEKFYWMDGRGVRQYQSVVKDKQKSTLIAQRARDAHGVRDKHGRGAVYRTTLLSKLLCLFANKFASLDAQGVGIEMEADKPSWYDALNGLPGLAGSSVPETFELKRLAIFLIQALDELEPSTDETLDIPAELFEFVQGLEEVLERHFHDKFRRKNMAFWEKATSLKEKFREKTFLGLSGVDRPLLLSRFRVFLEHAREKIEIGLQKAFDSQTGLYCAYFENKVVRHEKLKKAQGMHVRPRQFEPKALPIFLEALVHALKVERDPEKRKAIYRAVRRSDLYDEKLGMYKVNGCMKEASLEVGRARVFTPGWLENQSVWLHMEYKYLLEVLKSGMHEEFFHDFQKALVPFQPPERYGRSVLENSSFIVSSVFPDDSLHGAGFVARLSGSTAEFLNMWLFMNVGKRPFVLGPDKKVSLRFEPHLPAFLFTQKETVRVFVEKNGQERAVKISKDCLAFMFLGKTLVVYHNPKRLDTFGKLRGAVKKVSLLEGRGRVIEFKGDTIPNPFSLRVRDGFIARIDIELG